MTDFLAGMRLYITEVFISISLSISEHLFIYLWPFGYFWKNIYPVYLPIAINFLVIEMYALYILNINVSFHVWFAIFFSYTVGYIFILLIVSFAVEKLLGLI